MSDFNLGGIGSRRSGVVRIDASMVVVDHVQTIFSREARIDTDQDVDEAVIEVTSVRICEIAFEFHQ